MLEVAGGGNIISAGFVGDLVEEAATAAKAKEATEPDMPVEAAGSAAYSADRRFLEELAAGSSLLSPEEAEETIDSLSTAAAADTVNGPFKRKKERKK